MNTAQAIENMTDAAAFEVLAVQVLKLKHVDCASYLEHTGINADGKAIPDPLDGFGHVPRTTPPRFIMAAFTTTAGEGLERKWLFEHSQAPNAKKAKAADDGDLIKAHRHAQALRTTHPDAMCTVYLCTNNQPNSALLTRAAQRGTKLGLSVVFLTRSGLRDVLDVDPDGQYLRQKHLGIDSERLSLELLRDLGARSLERYGQDFVTAPDTFVTTSSGRALAAELSAKRPLTILTGNSGSGKSVACYQVLRDHLCAGGIGFRVPGEIAAAADSLDQAIAKTLQSLPHRLSASAGQEALAIAAKGHPLLLIIDDINRDSQPTVVMRKILAWHRPADNGSSKDTTQQSSASVLTLVPAWDHSWAPFERTHDKAAWVSGLRIRGLDQDEAVRCLRAALGERADELSETEQTRLVASLEHDPILIALFAQTTQGDMPDDLPTLANRIIDDFVHEAWHEAAASSGLAAPEFESALANLARWMIRARNLYPRWSELRPHLGPEAMKTLGALTTSGRLCRIVDRDGKSHLEFRHDRVLAHFLARALGDMLDSPDAFGEFLSDPFYIPFVGQAVGSLRIAPDGIAWLEEHAPLSLIAAIGLLPSGPDGYADRITDAAARWLATAANAKHMPERMLFHALRMLEGTNSPRVLTVTEPIADKWYVGRARLANGRADAIIGEFSSRHGFTPETRDSTFADVLERGLSRHGPELVRQCASSLVDTSVTDARRFGALVLAGYLGDPLLAQPVAEACGAIGCEGEALVLCLWATLRCASNTSEAKINKLLDIWAALPDDQADRSAISPRRSISLRLHWAMAHGLPEASLRCLSQRALRDDGLCWPITYSAQRTDHPLAVMLDINYTAKAAQRAAESGKDANIRLAWPHYWDATDTRFGRRMSDSTRSFLLETSKDDLQNRFVRDATFVTWIVATDDLDELRTIPEKHSQFDRALRRRARLGDRTALEPILTRARDDAWWFDQVARIWSPEALEPFEATLAEAARKRPPTYGVGSTNDDTVLSYVLRDMPRELSEPLLLKYWDRLQYGSEFVEAALYIGSAELVERATKAIARYPADRHPLKYVNYFFGFNTVGLAGRLTMDHMERLLPFVPQLDSQTVIGMTYVALERGQRDWVLQRLKPEIDRRRGSTHSESDDEEPYVGRLGRILVPSDSELLAALDRIESQKRVSPFQVERWSRTSTNATTTPSAGRPFSESGFRKALRSKDSRLWPSLCSTLGLGPTLNSWRPMCLEMLTGLLLFAATPDSE